MSKKPEVPRIVGLLGLVLAMSALLPITPSGASFLELLFGEFRRGPLEGLLMLAGFGSPYLFGLGVAITVLARSDSPQTRQLVLVPLALIHGQLALVAFVVWRGGDVIGAPALLGFSVVAGLHFAFHSAKSHAEGTGPSLAWSIRWGALVLAGVAAWVRLQRYAEIHLGVGLDVMLATAVSMVVAIGPRRLPASALDGDGARDSEGSEEPPVEPL